MKTTDSPDVVITKQLLDYAKQGGFTFQRAAPGEEGPLVGYRVNDRWVDLIHIEGFSRDCFAWRKRTSSLIVSEDALVQRQVEGSVLDVMNALLTGVRRQRWDGQAADDAASLVASLPMTLHDDGRDRLRAWELARRYDNHLIYDMLYVALAERLGEPLVTIDDKLRRRLARLEPGTST